jgi:hypothetical protein
LHFVRAANPEVLINVEEAVELVEGVEHPPTRAIVVSTATPAIAKLRGILRDGVAPSAPVAGERWALGPGQRRTRLVSRRRCSSIRVDLSSSTRRLRDRWHSATPTLLARAAPVPRSMTLGTADPGLSELMLTVRSGIRDRVPSQSRRAGDRLPDPQSSCAVTAWSISWWCEVMRTPLDTRRALRLVVPGGLHQHWVLPGRPRVAVGARCA